jgi:hypothetical protein
MHGKIDTWMAIYMVGQIHEWPDTLKGTYMEIQIYEGSEETAYKKEIEKTNKCGCG